MAAISGHRGSVTFATGYTVNSHHWTMDIEKVALDVTTFGNAWRRRIRGLSSFSGTIECYVDDRTPVNFAGDTPAAVVLRTGTGDTYNGNILVTGGSVDVAVDGAETVSYTFESDGALTITHGTTTTTTSTTSTTPAP